MVNILKFLDDYFSRNERKRIKELKGVIEHKNNVIESLKESLDDLNNVIDDQEEEISDLNKQIGPVAEEEYWNTVRPHKLRLYPARHLYGENKNSNIDPRVFFTNINQSHIPRISGGSNDEKAMNALKTVINMIDYVSDQSQFKRPETWLFPFETMQTRKGDCEDGAILLANMMLKAGIPYWRVRLNAGEVKGGGHAWVTYLRESDGEWYTFDWCYWPESSTRWKKWKNSERYFKIWFSWNKRFIFSDEDFGRELEGGEN